MGYIGKPVAPEPKKPDYYEQREILIAYLMSKVHIGDWHGVSDAANDLRVLEAIEEGRVKAELTWTHNSCARCDGKA